MKNEFRSFHNNIDMSKFCIDAGFLNIVAIGQYFMAKDTADLSQFHAVACREYTLPREDEASQPRGLIQGNTKLRPVLEVATCCLHGMYGVENRIWSLNGDNSHSWVRISHGSNKLVMDLNNNDTEIPEDQLEDQALQLDAKDFACRSKAKQNHKEENLLTLHLESFRRTEGLGLKLNQGSILSLRTKFRRK